MRTRQPTTTKLEDQRIPVRAKLAAAWTSFMFLYAYVDIIAFFKPGVVPDILAGKVWEFDVSQTLLTTFLALMAIPIFLHAVAPNTTVLGLLAILAGGLIAPSIASQSVLVSRLAPAHYATEAFTWSSTAILVGLGSGVD